MRIRKKLKLWIGGEQMTWIMMQAMRLMSSYVFSKFAEFVVGRLFKRAKIAPKNTKPPASRTTIDKKNDD